MKFQENYKYYQFVLAIRSSCSIITDTPVKEVPISSKLKHRQYWNNLELFFDTHECSIILNTWYRKCGKEMLKQIDKGVCANIIPESAFTQAIYMIGEGNRSKDKRYIIDLMREAISNLYNNYCKPADG